MAESGPPPRVVRADPALSAPYGGDQIDSAPLTPGCMVKITAPSGRERWWRVCGVYYGAVGQEDLVGLESMESLPGAAHGQTVTEMLVPLALLYGTTVSWHPAQRVPTAGPVEHATTYPGAAHDVYAAVARMVPKRGD